MTTKKCVGPCGETLPLDAFYRQHTGKLGRQATCKRCQRSNAAAVRRARRAAGVLTESQSTRLRLKYEVLRHYGGNQPACACCNTTYVEFLTIDHVNGGGRKHREQIGASGLYTWLKRKNFPEGFRVLCFNCNYAVSAYGYSPAASPERAITGPPPRKRKVWSNVRERILAELPHVHSSTTSAICVELAAKVGCAVGTVYRHRKQLLKENLWSTSSKTTRRSTARLAKSRRRT